MECQRDDYGKVVGYYGPYTEEQAAKISKRLDEALIAKLEKEAEGKPGYFEPGKMTPWMEDYYYGRNLR